MRRAVGIKYFNYSEPSVHFTFCFKYLDPPNNSVMTILEILLGGRNAPITCNSVRNLKTTIHCGTVDNGFGKGEANTAAEINQVLYEKPNLASEAVSIIKARIKDKNASTSKIAMDLLGELMSTNDHSFHTIVQQKVLSRVSKLAAPNKGIHPHVQRRAEALIRVWGTRYGSVHGLEQFGAAAAKLGKPTEPQSSVICQTSKTSTVASLVIRSHSWPKLKPTSVSSSDAWRKSCIDLSSMSKPEVVELAKASQKAIMEQIRSSTDPEKIASLRNLHDQLSEDIEYYYARKAKSAC